MAPHALADALALLPQPGRRGLDLRWLVDSHRAPGQFFERLFALLPEVSQVGAQSALGRSFDLYADMVTRHLGSGATALRVHDPSRSAPSPWRTLSYEGLDQRCATMARAWRAQGVEAGASVCVVSPFGEQAIIALLTGLRLGACVSLLEPDGPDYLARRLALLAPAYVACDPFHAGWLGEDPDALDFSLLRPELDASALPPSPSVAGSHCYDPEAACALLFSPLRPEAEQPVPLTAANAFSGALRDGALCLALRPGDALAAPGFDAHQHQPALLFAALIMGASYVHIDEDALLRAPELLSRWPLRSLGLRAGVRDALLAAGPGQQRPRWEHLFKNPEEPCDWLAWRELIEGFGLEKIALSNLVFDAAAGGCLLASPRRPALAALAQLMDVCAAPGRAWALLDFSKSGQRTPADVGVFAPLEGVVTAEDEGDLGGPAYLVLGHRRGPEYLYGGTTEPRRCGQVYPVDEVLDALADCPFLHAASLVPVVSGGATLAYRFVLLGFTGSEDEAHFMKLRAPRISELLRVLDTRLGPRLLPDHVELFPCHARLRDGQVDHAWCRDQYLGGALLQKRRAPAFRRLDQLRAMLLETPA
ncbi:long-chain fatty acid--CoA ligase [Pseudenhygromyxa sp. WMMC2535]|uniref:long-chain fatty acid--CoA ligase n=1 Tax=Pseudenhygromyxa sp. WMMC2535 TaxID=2712867 RepID=UPI0015522028|nr:long-chain fatty acid--CoA ligase [Pseudenhygromyxa sp. WMMC2535]NVB39230.1 long-chain fatty acid--CoA ligase [Pseudenhygromyxa sp. WMMC2535]